LGLKSTSANNFAGLENKLLQALSTFATTSNRWHLQLLDENPQGVPLKGNAMR